MSKNKLLLLLALLLTAATGAWAQDTYKVSLKDGVKDADKWTITPTEATTTGIPENTEVTLQYTGRLKVKGVKATSDAAAASVPDGAISGVFSVSSTKKVYFSKGNLRYASSKWSFFDNQYDYYDSHSEDAWDHFGWSTSATTYGMSTSTDNSDYSGDFVDWGATMGTGWFTLNKDEWTYLINTRSASTVNGTENGRYAKAKVNDVKGVILFPDTYTHPDGVTTPTNVNTTNASFDSNTYTVADWTKMETAGCVFLPAAGYRYGSSVKDSGTDGIYWSATPAGASNAYGVYFAQGGLLPADTGTWPNGCSVRLVREVATSDAAAAGNSVDLSTLTADYEAQDGDVLTGTLGDIYKITIADGATVTLSGAVINGTSNNSYKWAGLTLAGDGTIILSGENSVKGFYENYPGISVPANKTLTIQGDGSLNASSNGYGAGIGGGWSIACGNITIEGGTVTATGGDRAAGIGGGYNTSCGNISITGGIVTATCGKYAAGIGSGYNTSCGNISITGGTVTATGGIMAAGIGGGRNASCGDITIANTVTKVTATKGTIATNSIGAGMSGSVGTVTIGGNVGAITESPYTYQPSN